MQNANWKTENEEQGKKSSVIQFPFSAKKICPACGAEAKRENAKYCRVCAKFLHEDYQPLDTLRSSGRLQGKSFLIENAQREEIINLFPKNENTISETAWACLVYSLVPYIGILFVPLTMIIGIFGVAISLQRQNSAGRKLAFISFISSFVVLGIQIFLWWLLYFIPEIGKRI